MRTRRANNPTGKNGPRKTADPATNRVSVPGLGDFEKPPLVGAVEKKRNTLSPEQTAYYRDRREKAWSLHLAGASLGQIAKQLGYYGPSNVRRDLERVRARMPPEPKAAALHTELTRIEAERLQVEQTLAEMLARDPKDEKKFLFSPADRLRAINQARAVTEKLADRKARLVGLYAPTRTEVTGADGAAVLFRNTAFSELSDEVLRRIVETGDISGPAGPLPGAGGAGASPEGEDAERDEPRVDAPH